MEGAEIEGLLRGERLVVARCLNDAEDQREPARDRTRALLGGLTRSGREARAHRVGITGPPGVGKSSLVAALVRTLSGPVGRSVGVLAVDPSSPRSGGALLGDRVRIATGEESPRVFIRSLATRGELGGLARAVPDLVVILSAAFDVVVVETVGVGQSETDVRDVVDTLVFVVQPGAGDTLQHLKAGVMEVPDLFVVNKADTGGLARETRGELIAALVSLKHAGIVAETPKVVLTSARDGAGIDELVTSLDAHRSSLVETGELSRRRRAAAITLGERGFRRRYGELGMERAGGAGAVRAGVERGLAGGADVTSVVLALNPFDEAAGRGA